MNTVQYILRNRPLSYDDRLNIKQLGRPTPELDITKLVTGKSREFKRYFNKENSYDRFEWICGCPEVNRLFCFVCMLSNDLKASPWISQGVDDLQHLQERGSRHEKCTTHLNHLIDYHMLGKTDMRKQLFDTNQAVNILAHNEKINKNRHILRRVIMCVKFCGEYELPLLETRTDGPSILAGQIDFATELDTSFSDHLKKATVFQGTSKIIQNEILDAMLQVCRSEILKQIKKSNYIAIQVDEMTGLRFSLVIRYVLEGEIFERFWGFFQPTSNTAVSIASTIIKELQVLEIPPDKLIAQSYDGTILMSSKHGGVQSIVRETYHNACYVHSYAHDNTTLLEKAACCSKKMKIFFAEVQAFADFFSASPQRAMVLEEIIRRRVPTAAPGLKSDVKIRIINTLYDTKDIITKYLETILDTERDLKTVKEVDGLLKTLQSSDFNYFLEELRSVIPNVDVFFQQVDDSREANSEYIRNCLSNFESRIMGEIESKFTFVKDEVENHYPDERNSDNKRPRLVYFSEDNKVVLKEFCDILVNQITDRYEFTAHLSAVDLFAPDFITTYNDHFPEENFKTVVETYPVDREKLKPELMVIYAREDMRFNGILQLLSLITRNGLQDGLSQSFQLLEMLCTTPMRTSEAERCFNTLKRIKNFWKNVKEHDKLDALAMLSIEKKLVKSIDDFDNEVICVFASKSHRQNDFDYKVSK